MQYVQMKHPKPLITWNPQLLFTLRIYFMLHSIGLCICLGCYIFENIKIYTNENNRTINYNSHLKVATSAIMWFKSSY